MHPATLRMLLQIQSIPLAMSVESLRGYTTSASRALTLSATIAGIASGIGAENTTPGDALSALDHYTDAPVYWLTGDAMSAFHALRIDAPIIGLGDAEKRIVVLEGGLDSERGVLLGYTRIGSDDDGEAMHGAGFVYEVPGAPVRLGGDRGAHDADMRLLDWIIDNPDLVERKAQLVGKPPSKAAKRRGKARDDRTTVTVIDLRAAPKRQLDAVSEAERTYRHRWIVRGHWHTYKVGPGRAESRVKYVMPYVKGPEGAPMIESIGTVHRW